MFPIESFQKTVLKIVQIFEQYSIPFHLTGGVTNVAYGEPRMTQDIDIVIGNDATRAKLDEFITSLEDHGFIFDRLAVHQAVDNKKMFQLFDPTEALKLDIYPREMIPGELSRSKLVEVFEQIKLPVVSKVDAAASKLVWISKGSHKSRRDFRQLIRLSSPSEIEEIGKLVSELGLTGLMGEVNSESDEID